MGKRAAQFKNKGKKKQKIVQKSEPLNEIKNGFGSKKSMIPCSTQGNKNQEDICTSPGRSDEDHDLNEENGSEFNNLLKVLSSGNKNLTALYKKRQREQEGLSDSDEDQEDINEEGSGDESNPLDLDEEGSGDESGPSDLDENDEEINIENDEDSVEEYSDVEITVEKESLSSFYLHLAKSLTKEELDKLKEIKWKFKWEIPASDIQSSKWIGTGVSISKEIGLDMACYLREKIHKHWQSMNKSSKLTKENFFFSLFNTYRDVMHCNKRPFYMKGTEEDSSIMDAYLLHCLNHVYRTRELVIKNDTKLNKLEAKKEEILRADSYLDQGFTRPKVLFLLPLASIALRVVLRLIQLTPLSNKDNVEHLDRFTDEFGAIDDENEDKNNSNEDKKSSSSKPSDFRALFNGNNNDHFVLGMKFTKRTIKLYSDFYSSDIIIASPLGIITKIGETEYNKDKDVDYLSSIEVVIIDHADVISMQNWTHVHTIFEHLNKTPSKQHGTDMMRIRPWYLDGQAQFYRQTILLGSYLNPDINALFNRLCVNYEGKVKLVSEYKGVLPKILLQVQQIYERFNPSSIVDADDARLDYFCKKVFPKIKDSVEGGIMLFISSYFEFVRIRNFLKAQNASFCLLGEYTKQSDISRARVWFFEGKRKIMLYTERAHFYHRYKIRGIQNLIIYSLPERKEFYTEIINMIDGSRSNTCRVLFSPFDLLKLERIVGTSSAKRLLSSDKDMFVFS